MVRKPNPPKGAGGFKAVVIHPEIYKQLAHDALDADLKLWEQVHKVLCAALGRDDLAIQVPQPASAVAE